MPRDLFQDLGLERRSAGGWRALPASLAVHALAGIAVAALLVRPVANAFEERHKGVLQLQGSVATPAPAAARTAPTAPATVRPAARTAPPAPAPAPVPVAPPDLALPTDDDFDDTPAPCLTNCGDGLPGSTGTGVGPGDGQVAEDPGARGGQPVPIGGDLRAPRKTRHVLPEYPELARRAGVGGVVIVQCVIDVDGRVSDAGVLRGHPLLDAAALEAVRRWRYEPTRLNGIAVPVVMTVTVTFQPQR